MASGQLRARSSRGVACLALTAAATLGAAAPDASGPPSPSPTATGSPHAGEMQSPLAGWPAGAGRQRPGRSAAEVARQDALEDREPRPSPSESAVVPVFTPDPADFRDPPPAGRQALSGTTVRRVQHLSLGAGIALVGLGLGFLALRMRRAR
ncbi:MULTISPECIES: hypothetical protein [unclassified Streptomyces]|uniref:hypothetical protein n=1 Tax=unclassified Streptomyces TaxID=2593676 RepID=UPI002E2D8885|nr:hypothetical protein [Streptomyces sp. NBC_00441]